MKKLIFYVTLFGLIVVACQSNDEEVTPTQESISVDMSDFYVYTNDDELSAKSNGKTDVDRCHSMVVLNRELNENPGLYQKMYAIEKHTRQAIAAKKPPGTPGGGNSGGGNGGGGEDPTPFTKTVTIPVIVNIIETSLFNVTHDQVVSQIAVLNLDYNNGDLNIDPPEEFADLVADADITFVLADTIRRISSKTNWSADNSMKYASQGGIDVTDPAHNLNIWVVNNMISGRYTILSIAQYSIPTTDHIIHNPNI